MQPYQRATEEVMRQGEFPKRILEKAGQLGTAGFAASSVIGRGIAQKAMTFLSKYIPENLAVKGLKKLDPRFGKFIDKALGEGKSFDEIRDFMTQKAEAGLEDMEESKQPAKQSKNIIEQYSPELHQFMVDKVKKGENVYKAGALARFDKKFDKIIGKMEKDHKTDWSAIFQSVYGQQDANQVGTVKNVNPKQQLQANGNWDKIAASLQSLLNS